jgi:hypothetical protein
MQLRLPAHQAKKLADGLTAAGEREIGGQLFGEQLAPSDFRIMELSIQKRRGTFARFVVDLFQAARDAVRFFDRTKHRYTVFNYLGEWHSHPSFAVHPSPVDSNTMRDLVADPAFNGTFAVLMIAKLEAEKLSAAAWVFDPLGRENDVQLDIEP